jgi:hypothetical protein
MELARHSYAMTTTLPAALEQKLAAATSLHGISAVLAAEGLPIGELEIAQGLLQAGASTRFAGLSGRACDQLAQVLVLAESDPAIGRILLDPQQVTAGLPALLAAHALVLEPEALAALAAPLDLDDQQLEQVVGGIDPMTASLITLGITTLGGVLITWITKHYDTQKEIAAIQANRTA